MSAPYPLPSPPRKGEGAGRRISFGFSSSGTSGSASAPSIAQLERRTTSLTTVHHRTARAVLLPAQLHLHPGNARSSSAMPAGVIAVPSFTRTNISFGNCLRWIIPSSETAVSRRSPA